MRQACSQLCVFHLIHSIYKYIYKHNVAYSSGQADKWDKLGLGLGHGEGSESRKVGADCDVTWRHKLHQDQNREGLEDNHNHDDEDHDNEDNEDDKDDEDDEDDEDADQNVGGGGTAALWAAELGARLDEGRH